ncbi:uncharacterized protein [Lepeophtheirus salmonis]|uniref:uncharacterized protein n=1 Tax=Lepeophtheirus salmonis TaxID=72036 RepID=UPI003AF40764
MGGKEIEFSTQMKYLGVVFDQCLTWMEHLKEKAAKVSRIWNMGHSITTKKSAIKILNKIERKVLLAMTETLRSTPPAVMGSVLGIIPLDLFLQSQATKSRWRTRNFLVDTWDGIGSLPTRRGHRFSSDKIITELQLNQSRDYIKGSRTWIKNQEVNGPDIILYTDGSKDKEGNTGAGWAITRGDTSLHQTNVSLNKEFTVFQAEIFPIARSVKALTRMEKPSGDVVIRSDSQSAITAILNHSHLHLDKIGAEVY